MQPDAGKVQPSHTSGTFWHHVGLLGMLEKCNPHTLRALFDIMLDFWECWKSATLTHFGHFLTSCWTFGNAGKVQPSHTLGTFWHHVGPLGMLEKCNPHTLLVGASCWISGNAGKVQHSHTLGTFWHHFGCLECWKSATLTHFCPPSTWPQLGLPQLGSLPLLSSSCPSLSLSAARAWWWIRGGSNRVKALLKH